ncbi:hypothetical protein FJZ17_00940 [Candidatus Pacearchaeota archaeon]|nr:hypothetical protein [Candidatus Pacearchaeota archaeon]
MKNTSKYLAYAAFALAVSSSCYSLFQTIQIGTFERRGNVTEARTAERKAVGGLVVALASMLFGSRKLYKSIAGEEVVLRAAD